MSCLSRSHYKLLRSGALVRTNFLTLSRGSRQPSLSAKLLNNSVKNEILQRILLVSITRFEEFSNLCSRAQNWLIFVLSSGE